MKPPEPDEVEVSIFGPGKGESIAIHVAEGDWLVVDSCIDQRSRKHPVIEYLSELGVNLATDVKIILGTHAHDDHVAGISRLVDACEGAQFVTSSAMTGKEFFSAIEADGELQEVLGSRVLREYSRTYEILEKRGLSERGLSRVVHASEGRVLSNHGFSSSVTITALSPSDTAMLRARAYLAQATAVEGNEKRLLDADPNEFAIALWVEVGEIRCLLGADLVNGPAGAGWEAVLASRSSQDTASLFKVSHHGSPNAHFDEVWDAMLEQQPLALLTPYRAGVTPRPAPSDVDRIVSLASRAFVTASAKKPALSASARRTAGSLAGVAHRVRDPYGRVGQVRARRRPASVAWEVDTFGPAYELP